MRTYSQFVHMEFYDANLTLSQGSIIYFKGDVSEYLPSFMCDLFVKAISI